MYRQNAIEAALRRVDSAGIPSASQEEACCQIKRNAAQWRDDRAAATEIEARLTSLGFDERSIDLEVCVQAREIFIMFDNLMHSAQNRRIFLLREINSSFLRMLNARSDQRCGLTSESANFRLWTARFGAEFTNCESLSWISRGEIRVTTIEAVILGMMLSWTPSVLLMAYLFWRAPLEPD
jgi:hypothetical protein